MNNRWPVFSRRAGAALCGLILAAIGIRAARAAASPAASDAAATLAGSVAVSPAALVPAGMDFMLDVNLRAFLDGPEAKPLRAAILPQGYKQVVDQIYVATGADLLRDVDRAIVAGKLGAENKGDVAIILSGRWKPNGIVDALMNAPQYDSFPVGGQTVHQFWSRKDSDLRYVCFLDPGLAAVGKLKTIEGVIAAYEKRGDTMLGDPALAALAGTGAPALARIVARGGAAAEAIGGEAAAARPVLSSVRGAALEIGSGDALDLRATATLADPRAAKLALQALQGLQAFAQLQERRPELAEAAGRIECSLAGERRIQAGAKLPMDEALRLLAALRHNKDAQ